MEPSFEQVIKSSFSCGCQHPLFRAAVCPFVFAMSLRTQTIRLKCKKRLSYVLAVAHAMLCNGSVLCTTLYYSPNVLVSFHCRRLNESIPVHDFRLAIAGNDQNPLAVSRELQVNDGVAFTWCDSPD